MLRCYSVYLLNCYMRNMLIKLLFLKFVYSQCHKSLNRSWHKPKHLFLDKYIVIIRLIFQPNCSSRLRNHKPVDFRMLKIPWNKTFVFEFRQHRIPFFYFSYPFHCSAKNFVAIFLRQMVVRTILLKRQQ